MTLLGAHSAEGRALVEVLRERGLSDGMRAATTSEHLEGDLELVDAALLSAADVAVLCDDDPFLKTVAESLRTRGVRLIDMAEALERDLTTLVFPGLDDLGVGAALPKTVRVPLGPVEPVVAVLRSLASYQIRRVEITTFESAALRGRPGMEELSEQTRGIFTMVREDPKVFSQSLAFACVPSVAPEGVPAEQAERQFERDVRAGLPPDAKDADVGSLRVLVPSFSAEGVSIAVQVQDTPTHAEVTKALSEGRGLRVIPDGQGSTLDAVGRDDVLVTRIRTRPGGIHVFAVADRLRRGSATQAALLVEHYIDNLSLDT